jgi:hypothetical protein
MGLSSSNPLPRPQPDKNDGCSRNTKQDLSQNESSAAVPGPSEGHGESGVSARLDLRAGRVWDPAEQVLGSSQLLYGSG